MEALSKDWVLHQVLVHLLLLSLLILFLRLLLLLLILQSFKLSIHQLRTNQTFNLLNLFLQLFFCHLRRCQH